MEEKIAYIFTNLKKKELPNLAKPELEECVGADVRFNRINRQAFWKSTENINTFSGWNFTQVSVYLELFHHVLHCKF